MNDIMSYKGLALLQDYWGAHGVSRHPQDMGSSGGHEAPGQAILATLIYQLLEYFDRIDI